MMELSYKNSGSALFSVLGLPASGTTIIAHLLDSVDRVACISEPFFRDYNRTVIDPFGEINVESDREFFTLLARRGAALGLDMVGIKEVGILAEGAACRLHRALNHVDLFNVVLLTFRNPILNINSVLAQRAKFPRARFMDLVKTYHWLLNQVAEDPKFRAVVYERFCDNPVEELNRALSGIAEISGAPVLLQSSRNIRGDLRAWQSSSVVHTTNRGNVLSKGQIALLEAELVPLYLKLLT